VTIPGNMDDELHPKTLSAFVPDLPGCVPTGATLDDVKANIREAIEFHIREDNLPIPELSPSEFVKVTV
jgi:predicted RNase H-like HicB family nuclease